MSNLFFYTRTQKIEETQDQPAGERIFTDSFNLNKVIRSVEMEDGTLLILLDDLHERSEEVPDVKNGKIVGKKRERNTYQTEVRLNGDDVKRFNNLPNN